MLGGDAWAARRAHRVLAAGPSESIDWLCHCMHSHELVKAICIEQLVMAATGWCLLGGLARPSPAWWWCLCSFHTRPTTPAWLQSAPPEDTGRPAQHCMPFWCKWPCPPPSMCLHVEPLVAHQPLLAVWPSAFARAWPSRITSSAGLRAAGVGTCSTVHVVRCQPVAACSSVRGPCVACCSPGKALGPPGGAEARQRRPKGATRC